ncbi:fumarylacetoacetate hydrolase family protein [Marinicrinis lubricantis]|uniref:Fumarylacetoacetate hydrolase family protein n=1 Tax=Marinicrinis lubricantis TaxID=2086470 RepID=A0ABW1IJD1_9BACL
MRIVRYDDGSSVRIAALTDEEYVYALDAPDFMTIVRESQEQGMTTLSAVQRMIAQAPPIQHGLNGLKLLPPIDAPEVWAAGVTYERSKEARNMESNGGGIHREMTFYDKVYNADRPELFMKSTAARTVGPNDAVYLRSDSRWHVPESELALVLDSTGTIVGYTIGNDMSCRDIEGENPLYLPQAKIWRNSCAIGPAIRLAETVSDPYALRMACRIFRSGHMEVEETGSTAQLKRKLDELVQYLVRDNVIFDGTVLLTGTCIVPPDSFTLASGDRIEISIDGIGTLVNTALSV